MANREELGDHPRRPRRPGRCPAGAGQAVPVRQRRPAAQPAHRAALAGARRAAGQRRGMRTDRRPHSARTGARAARGRWRRGTSAPATAACVRAGAGAGPAGARRARRRRADAASRAKAAARAGAKRRAPACPTPSGCCRSHDAASAAAPASGAGPAAPAATASAGCGAPPTAACRRPSSPCSTPPGTRSSGTAYLQRALPLARALARRRPTRAGKAPCQLAPGRSQAAVALRARAGRRRGRLRRRTRRPARPNCCRFWELAAAGARPLRPDGARPVVRAHAAGRHPHRGRRRLGQFQEGDPLADAGRRAGPGRSVVRPVAHIYKAGIFAAQRRRGPEATSSAPPRWATAPPSSNAATAPGARAARTKTMTCARCTGCRRRRRTAAPRPPRRCARSRRARPAAAYTDTGALARRRPGRQPSAAGGAARAGRHVQPEPGRSAAARCPPGRPGPLPGDRHPRQLRPQQAPPGAGRRRRSSATRSTASCACSTMSIAARPGRKAITASACTGCKTLAPEAERGAGGRGERYRAGGVARHAFGVDPTWSAQRGRAAQTQRHFAFEHRHRRPGQVDRRAGAGPGHRQFAAARATTRTGESSRPRRMPATTAAQAPVPQASVSPAPRSNTRSLMWWRSTTCMKPALTRFGKRGWCSISGPVSSTGARVDVVDHLHRVRIAHRDDREQQRLGAARLLDRQRPQGVAALGPAGQAGAVERHLGRIEHAARPCRP